MIRSFVGWIEHRSIFFVLVGLLGFGVLLAKVEGQGISEATLRTSQLRSCTSLNVERARNNRALLHIYQADVGSLAYDETFKGLVAAGLKHQTSQVARTSAQEQETKLFIFRLEGEIMGIAANLVGIEWVALTKCYPATDEPLTYVPPKSRPFATVSTNSYGHLVVHPKLPPYTVLQVGPGE